MTKKQEYQHGEKYKKQEKVRTKLNRNQGGLRLVLAILILLFVLSTCMTVWRLYYVCLRDDYEVELQYDGGVTEVTIFSMQYRDARGEVIVSSVAEDKVIAPGSVAEVTVGFVNKDEIALDYVFEPRASINQSYEVPIEFRILDNTGTYIAGDVFTWIPASEIKTYSDNRTLKVGQKITYTIQWRWPFEDDRDEFDTAMGNKLEGDPILIELAFDAFAQINSSVEANDGNVESLISSEVYTVGLWIALTLLYIFLMILVIMRLLTAKVDLLTIQQNFMPDAKVTLDVLKKRGIVKKRAKYLVITNKNDTKIRFAVDVYANRYENDADLTITLAGGLAKRLKKKKK